MFFAKAGKSVGIGVQAGMQVAGQSGSLNEVVAPTGEGGGTAINVTASGGSMSVSFDDDMQVSGGGFGAGGPAALTWDNTDAAIGTAPVNLKDLAKEIAGAPAAAKKAIKQVVRQGSDYTHCKSGVPQRC